MENLGFEYMEVAGGMTIGSTREKKIVLGLELFLTVQFVVSNFTFWLYAISLFSGSLKLIINIMVFSLYFQVQMNPTFVIVNNYFPSIFF